MLVMGAIGDKYSRRGERASERRYAGSRDSSRGRTLTGARGQGSEGASHRGALSRPSVFTGNAVTTGRACGASSGHEGCATAGSRGGDLLMAPPPPEERTVV